MPPPDVECLVSEAFTDSEASEIIEHLNSSSSCEPSSKIQRSALQTTLGVASSAANFVLFPYVIAGKAAMKVTSIAVTAPIHFTNHVRASIAQSWTSSNEDPDLIVDTNANSLSDVTSPKMMELAIKKQVKKDNDAQEHENSVVSQLLFLPVRLVNSSVSTAAALPSRVATYSGRKISGAVSTSHALVTSALVASTGVVARTGIHVAKGITHGAVSTASLTASTISGAVGASMKTVNYVIPPSVSNIVWQGMDITGNASVNVLSYAIAVPSYRMVRALVPAIDNFISEEDAVNETRSLVKVLVKLLGPQNAVYLLKWVYETVNSEEAHDAFLLCCDIVHESLHAENYRHVGASVSAATGLTNVVHLMKEAYNVLPSFDEMEDAVILIADVSDEVVDGVAHVVNGKDALDAQRVSRKQVDEIVVVDDDEHWAYGSMELSNVVDEYQESKLSPVEQMNPLFESGLSLLTRICDSDEASSLFNTLGDLLDVLVE
ncbi:hypothetical protein PsorP6_008247 [Peronosclerospora sorghi]|uniref:Uncharacterized protein n=1 Tax=Peronosclerospora sorghi TaxID=230839 RepID=A0ACC0W9F5_9STRA|nr:hypothetical protein PsorP6_008247 [Peronosclerospora sorghi]